MEATSQRHPSPGWALVQVAVASLLGMLGLPALMTTVSRTEASATGQTWIQSAAWLVVAGLIVVWLLVVAPDVVRLLSGIIARYARRDARDVGSLAAFTTVAVWVVAAAYTLVAQTILRRPLILTLEPLALNALALEAIYGTVALTLLLVALVRLHTSAHPIVETLARSALDDLFATSGPAEAPGQVPIPYRPPRSQVQESPQEATLGRAAPQSPNSDDVSTAADMSGGVSEAATDEAAPADQRTLPRAG